LIIYNPQKKLTHGWYIVFKTSVISNGMSMKLFNFIHMPRTMLGATAATPSSIAAVLKANPTFLLTT